MNFKLVSQFKPTGDQPEAIKGLVSGIRQNYAHQVLLGVTGSGKTFTMASVINEIQRSTLIISHNKTLAAQLYQEFRDFFPENAVSYFVSYYDYYQPEAYIPQVDTYIEKETEINEMIDRLRLRATTNLLTRKDTIIVASVSCIYNIGSPREYGHFVLELKNGGKIKREKILERLTQLQYERSGYEFKRGTFRVRGETIDIFPAYEEDALRLEHDGRCVVSLAKIDPLNGKKVKDLEGVVIYPAKHYMTDPAKTKDALPKIRRDLAAQVAKFKREGKELEAHRINQRVNYDLEMIAQIGYVNGIENYSRYFDGRKPGEPPYTLLDYFREPYGNDWLLFIDESHMTIPQLQGMYNGDQSRKEVLIDFGFRLPAALDNRPLRFEEFLRRIPQTIYVSATPDQWEIQRASMEARNFKFQSASSDTGRFGASWRKSPNLDHNGVVEQLVRPTGIVDPEIIIKPTPGQIDDLVKEISERVKRDEKVLVTTLTKRMAEDLSEYLKEKGIKVNYLHSDIKTLERSDILDDFRLGKYDVIVGINLLREGLDLPEVSLVVILDADKEGFLRSKISLIQTMGRAARHINGQIIMYADTVTGSMKRAIEEISRRRQVQLDYNKKFGITPQTIKKPIREKLVTREEMIMEKRGYPGIKDLETLDLDGLTPQDRTHLVKKLEQEMRQAARDLEFEEATIIRDKIREITSLME